MSNFQCTQCSGHLALPQLSVQYTQSVLLAVHYPTSTPPYFPHSLDLIADDLERMVEAGVWSTGKIKALYPRRPGDDAASWKRHGGPLEKSRPSFASLQHYTHSTAHQPWDPSSDLTQKPCCEERRRCGTHNLPADADLAAGTHQDVPDRRADLDVALECVSGTHL